MTAESLAGVTEALGRGRPDRIWSDWSTRPEGEPSRYKRRAGDWGTRRTTTASRPRNDSGVEVVQVRNPHEYGELTVWRRGMSSMKQNHMFFRSFKAFSFALIFFVVTALFATRSQAQNGLDDFRRGEVLVEIKPGASIDAINERYGTSTIQRIYGTNFYRLGTPKHKKEVKFRKRLANDVDVLSAALNPVITTPINVFGRAVIGFPGDHPATGELRAN